MAEKFSDSLYSSKNYFGLYFQKLDHMKYYFILLLWPSLIVKYGFFKRLYNTMESTVRVYERDSDKVSWLLLAFRFI